MRIATQTSHLVSLDPSELDSLESLLGRLRAKAPGAAAQFFDRYERQVNQLVWALLGADVDHDDLVSTAFEAMFRQVGSVRSAHALKGWVRTVTINVVRLELRRRRWRRLFTGGEPEALAAPDLRVGDAAQRERARDVYRALGRLSGDDRVIVVLRHVEEYELTEVAAAMNCSLATIKRRLVRAEAKLETLLGGA